jgi:hypothetical protein
MAAVLLEVQCGNATLIISTLDDGERESMTNVRHQLHTEMTGCLRSLVLK